VSGLRDVPIRQKLLVITTVTVALSLTFAGVVFYIWDYRSYRQYVTQDVGTTAAVVAENVNAAVAFRDPAAASETLSSLRAKPHVAAACVYDEHGAVFAAYSRPGATPTCPEARTGRRQVRDGRGLIVYEPVMLDGKVIGTLYLRRTFEDLDGQMQVQSTILVIIIAVALTVGLLLSNRLHRFVSVPIVRLADVARDVAARRDYSIRAERYGRDELGTLVDAFNEMLAKIQESAAELHRTQEQLERTVGELQEAHRLKDEFLATVSHELRTPLNAMLGWSRMLRVDPGMERDKRQRAVESIERNALAQARIVDDLLDIARIVSGKLRLELRPVHLSAVISAAADVVRPAASTRDVQLVVDAGGVKDDLVLGDADRLQQMIWNLISNGVKFTPGGGLVRVELLRDDQLEVRVSDNGRGIDPEFLPHAFDLFRQGDSSSTREVGGLGLGLAIAQRIVELHGGSITLHSDGRNTGTTAVVRLPALSSRARAALA
jgi:signal transduction histidine kinase